MKQEEEEEEEGEEEAPGYDASWSQKDQLIFLQCISMLLHPLRPPHPQPPWYGISEAPQRTIRTHFIIE